MGNSNSGWQRIAVVGIPEAGYLYPGSNANRPVQANVMFAITK